MRIAYFSPLPPASSGIADYSAELLPYLQQHADITLFVEPGMSDNDALAGAFPMYDAELFGERRAEFEVPLYHMGNNSTFHEYIFLTLRAVPGIVVAHETVFYHFLRQITLDRGDLDTFRRLLQDVYYSADVEHALRHVDDWQRDRYLVPALTPVLTNARGVIVHSQYARQQIQQCRPDLPVAVIPHHLSLPAPFDSPLDRHSIRRDLGLAGRFVVASFGFITEAKRPAILLRAFARFHRRHPDTVCCLVGEVSPGMNLAGLMADLGLPAEAVRVTGRVPLEVFLRYMAATDVAVNLRYPTSGETSGSVIRLLGLGVPTIVSDVGAFSEFPADVCATVPVDASEEDTLVAILRTLAADDRLRQTMGENARRHIRTHHTLEGSARAYATFLEQVVAGEAGPVGLPATSAAAEVLSDIGAALAGWGVTEHHDALLRPIARAMAELRIGADAHDQTPARP